MRHPVEVDRIILKWRCGHVDLTAAQKELGRLGYTESQVFDILANSILEEYK